MSARLQRFDFGALRDFRGPLVETPVELEAPEPPPPPPPPVFSEAEMEASRQSGYEHGYHEGLAAGRAQAEAEADAKRQAAEAAMRAMGQMLGDVGRAYDSLLNREAETLSQLVLRIARKVANAALDAQAAQVITALVSECLPVMLSKPRLMIDLHPELFQHAIDPIEALLQASGFEGEVQFRSNTDIGPYDTILDWVSGQASRDTESLWQEIETLLSTMPIGLAPIDIADHSTPIPPAPLV